MAAEKMRDETGAAFLNILNTFSGEDGGAGFVAFRTLLQEMDAKAKKGDKAAQEIVLLVTRMSKLIDIAKREMYGKS